MGIGSWFKKIFKGKAGGFVEGHLYNQMGGGIGGEIASRAAGAATAKGVDVGADAAANKIKKKKDSGGAAAGGGDKSQAVNPQDWTHMKVISMSGDAGLVETEDGDRVWVQGFQLRWPDGTHCDEWPDEWGPLANNNQDLNEFAYHMQSVDRAMMAPETLPEVVQRLGYTDVGQWYRVRMTFIKYYGQGDRSDVGTMVMASNEFNQAIVQAAGRLQQDAMAATAAANPQMLEPIEGVTVEQYAQVAAQAAQGLDQAAWQQVLAQNGMDQVKWDRIQAGCGERMRNDTTATIASIYGKAFQNQGAGQFGAAGQAAAATSSAQGAWGTGGAAAGPEPVPFEKLCEIQGAQTAWAESGQDVNAMLKQVFNMNALDWSNMSSWWMTKMMADPAMFEKYNQWCEHYKNQYLQQAGHNANPDGDISF